jgi:hypothetical protein
MTKLSQLKLTLLIMALCSVFSVFAVFAYSRAVQVCTETKDNCKVEPKGEMLLDVLSRQIVPSVVIQ